MANTIELIVKATDQATAVLNKIGGDIERKAESIKTALNGISMAWLGVGAAIIGGMGLMTKSAAEEEANINRLSIALKNVGVSYDNVKASLEEVITATQRKTGIADDEQRDVLSRLLLVTNDYNKALSLLPLTLDLAAAGQMDTSTAATYLGKAMLELEGGAESVTVRLGQASMQFSSLADIEARVGGAAQAAVNPLTVLKNELSDITEKLGGLILPTLKSLVDAFIPVVDKIKEWVDKNPELVKAIMAASLAIAGIITAVFALKGALLLLGSTANLVFGGILIAVGALVTGAVLLWQNWDKVGHFFADMWSNMKNAALHAIDTILAGLQFLLGWIPGWGDKFDEARSKISGMIEANKVARDMADIERSANELKDSINEVSGAVSNLSGQFDNLRVAGGGGMNDLAKAMALYTDEQIAQWQKIFGADWARAITAQRTDVGVNPQEAWAYQQYSESVYGNVQHGGPAVNPININLNVDGQTLAKVLVNPLGQAVAQRQRVGG